MAVPKISILRAVGASLFREESAKQAAPCEGVSALASPLRMLCAASYLGDHGRGERVVELATAHPGRLARALGTDRGRSLC